jgi:hypothetical protein
LIDSHVGDHQAERVDGDGGARDLIADDERKVCEQVADAFQTGLETDQPTTVATIPKLDRGTRDRFVKIARVVLGMRLGCVQGRRRVVVERSTSRCIGRVRHVMGVGLQRGAGVRVAELLVYVGDGCARLQQEARESVAQVVDAMT